MSSFPVANASQEGKEERGELHVTKPSYYQLGKIWYGLSFCTVPSLHRFQ